MAGESHRPANQAWPTTSQTSTLMKVAGASGISLDVAPADRQARTVHGDRRTVAACAFGTALTVTSRYAPSPHPAATCAGRSLARSRSVERGGQRQRQVRRADGQTWPRCSASQVSGVAGGGKASPYMRRRCAAARSTSAIRARMSSSSRHMSRPPEMRVGAYLRVYDTVAGNGFGRPATRGPAVRGSQ